MLSVRRNLIGGRRKTVRVRAKTVRVRVLGKVVHLVLLVKFWVLMGWFPCRERHGNSFSAACEIVLLVKFIMGCRYEFHHHFCLTTAKNVSLDRRS